MSRPPITLRGIATADAVRRFETQRIPMTVQPYPTGDVPAGWLPVLMAVPKPKAKSPSVIRRNQERRRRFIAEVRANG
jgi:hypothetical protein